MFANTGQDMLLTPRFFDGLMIFAMLAVALTVGFVLNRVFQRYATKFEKTWGEFLFSLLESLPIPLLLLGALYTGLEVLTLPAKWERIGAKLILALVIVVLFYFPAKVIILFLRRLSQRQPALERVAQPATFVIRALFALVAVIIFLENLGVQLTAVWTTLGVGSVAVALALQETLSNFFAGLYLLADRPIRPNDYIKLDSGHEGYVVQIRWRSTQLRTLSNNVIVVPNSTLAKATITNYSAPESRMSLTIPVSVGYGTDPKRVETVLTEIAQAAAREGVEGLLTEPAPFVRLIPGFGPSSLDFSLLVQVRQFTDQYLVQSELRKRILERFREEGIEIPLPAQSVSIEKAPPDALARRKPKK